MPTEEQIRELAYAIWQQEGRPEGKDAEHYFRARQILEQQETAKVIELPEHPASKELAAPEKTPELPETTKRRRAAPRKKKEQP